MPSILNSTGLHLALWLMACILLVAGAVAPMFTFTTFWIFDDTLSLLGGIRRLWQAGEWGLFLVVSGFSLLLPAGKLLLLYRLIGGTVPPAHEARIRRWLSQTGKWSMLEVFVVAWLVVMLQFGGTARITIHYGLYLFAAGVVASMLLTQLVEAGARRDG
ncbi:MAG: paraquat-inducible protein A [Chromatiales bacterium]|nr:paraquat-inducible protein A [Chromatiales bacterium]